MNYHSLSFRILALVSVIFILISCIAVPASATSNTTPDDDIFYDVLEFDSFTKTNSSAQKFPYVQVFSISRGRYCYIDSIVTTDASDLELVVGAISIPRYLISQDDMYYTYRFCGEIGWITSQLRVTFRGTNPSSGYPTVIFDTLKLSSLTLKMSKKPISAVLDAYPFEYVNGGVEGIDPGDVGRVTLDMDNSYNSYQSFDSRLTIDDWEAYDYIDVNLVVSASSISSIKVDVLDTYIPFEICYIDPDFENNDSYNEDYVLPRVYVTKILLRLDLRNVLRNGYPIYVTVDGTYCPWDGANYIEASSPIGLVAAEGTSSLSAFWYRLVASLDQHFYDLKQHLTSLLKPDQDAQSEIDQANDDLDEMEGVMDEIPDVDIDTVMPGTDFYEEYGGDLGFFGRFFQSLLENPIIFKAMQISLTLCLINVILIRK